MDISRRHFLLAAGSLPLVAACARGTAKLGAPPVEVLAGDLKVCAAAYATLRAGRPTAARSVNGCGSDDVSARIFQAASLTKPLTAYAALDLALKGSLELDAPVAQYLPNGYRHFASVLARAPGDAFDLAAASLLQQISVRQLLNHTSGLPNWVRGAMLLASTPGERWSYSGEGYVLLQSVIESIVGQEFSDYMDRHVFAPLGMTDTSLVWREDFDGRAVDGDTFLGRWRVMRFRRAVAAASMYTTAADYARLMAATLANDRMLSLMLADPVDVDAGLGLQWGLGWGIEHAADGPSIWQWGNNPGFRNFAMASVARRDGFVILTNSDHGMPLAASVARDILPGEHAVFRFPLAA